ncbi:MAG: 2-dehydropantoate 2-reductase, partial [Solirubrobacterales bacterium]|nr:2-dehydropantoate 2-reductase [Solirubrobacterales bacterium]
VRPHVDAINRDGLRLTGEADLVASVRATGDGSQIPPCEYGIVATKSMFTRPAIEASAQAFADGAVASVQNGVGNEEVIAEYVDRVIRGTTFPAGHVIAPGVVGMDTRGDTWLGPFEPRPASIDQVRTLADAITAGGMNTKALEDARGAQWTKLIFNAATNPIGALTGLTHGRVCELPELRRLVSALIDEGEAVADSLGIGLDSDPEQLVDHAAEVAYEHRASMLQDVLAKRATEIDAMNGGIAEFGAQQGVPTPLNLAIAALVKGLERSWSQPQ